MKHSEGPLTETPVRLPFVWFTLKLLPLGILIYVENLFSQLPICRFSIVKRDNTESNDLERITVLLRWVK